MVPPQNEVAGKHARKRGFGIPIPGSTGLTLQGGPATGGSERADLHKDAAELVPSLQTLLLFARVCVNIGVYFIMILYKQL